MPEDETTKVLQREREAFAQALPQLLAEHQGEYTVFKDRQAVVFCKSFADAYAEGLSRFGIDGVFLVTQVVDKKNRVTSLRLKAWGPAE